MKVVGKAQSQGKSGVKEGAKGDFPGGPAVKASRFHYRGREFHPWLGN